MESLLISENVTEVKFINLTNFMKIKTENLTIGLCGEIHCLGDNSPADLLPYIHMHWRTFKRPSILLTCILGIFHLIVAGVGLGGNASVILIYLRNSRVRIPPSNFLVANLATADILLMAMTPMFAFNAFLQIPAFGIVGCQVYGFLSLLAGLSAIWFLAAISYDRLRSVQHSANMNKRLSIRQVRRIACWIWIASFICSFLPFCGWGSYVPEGYLIGCTIDYLNHSWFNRSYIFLLLITAWLLPMSVILYAYGRIGLKICSIQKEINVFASSTVLNKLQHQREKRTIIKVFFLVVLWTSSWTPYALLVLLAAFYPSGLSNITPIMVAFTGLFCKVSACVNPYIYGLLLPSFRNEIIKCIETNIRLGKERPCQRSSCINRIELTYYDSNFSSRRIEDPVTTEETHHFISGRPSSRRGSTNAVQQHFLLPSGDVVIATSYKEAKKTSKRLRSKTCRQKSSFLNHSV